MGDLESLLLVLGIIYLTECTVWVRRGGIAVLTAWGKVWHVWHPGSVLGNSRGALTLANPLPPFGSVLTTSQFPVSLSPVGVFSFTAASINPDWRPHQESRWFAFADIQSVTIEGRNIELNNQLFLKAPSSSSARQLAGLIQQLKSLPVSSRDEVIQKAVQAMFDSKALQTRWRTFQSESRWLRLLGHVLFFYLFLIAPGLLWFFGLRHAGLPVVGGLLLQTVTIAMIFRRAHRALYPDGAPDRFVPFLTMLLAPPAAIRARDVLARNLAQPFHPLTVTQAFCSRAEFEALARHVLRDLSYPILPLNPSAEWEAVKIEESFRVLMGEKVRAFATQAGLKPDELVRSPARTESEQRAYCPRCHEQFIALDATCSQCGGRAVVAFG
jgi:hypothetical protein